ncbi:hypothetical protein C8R43DRAFT_1118891 [Mycena crocata]|nr:hypothetical protein C8R43DRAFT_1118891 [Mycena crocata]
MAGTRKKNSDSAPAAKPSGRKRTLTPKAKAAANKKVKRGKDDDSSEDSEEEADEADNRWKDPDLSVGLLAHIAENKAIKRSLYPPCGPNGSTAEGGGKPKVNAHWDLFVLLFGKNPKYTDALAACKTPKERLGYANKIKNRLRAMAKTTLILNKSMGETGAGIESAAEIDMNVTNEFTSKWAEYGALFPWYFDMRNLIAQRPNLVPTGLGDSTTPLTEGVIIPFPAADAETQPDDGEDSVDHEDGASIEWEATPVPELRKRAFSEIDDEGGAAGSGDEYEPSSPVTSESAPVNLTVFADDEEEDVSGKKKDEKDVGPAHPQPAAPAPAAAPKPSKKTKLVEFSEIAKNEEKTRQKELEPPINPSYTHLLEGAQACIRRF